MAAQDMADVNYGTRRHSRLPALAALAVFGCFLLFLAGIALFGRAADGDPVVTIDLKPLHRGEAMTAPTGIRARAAAGSATGETDRTGAASAPPPLPSAGAASQGAGLLSQKPEAPARPAVIDKQLFAGHALVADPGLIEQTLQGPLPRIADDGRAPMVAYAPALAPDKRPKIALVVSGLGISAKETETALAKLPPAVTLGFAPYADDVQKWMNEARAKGHEVLLEVPMEPFDFPDSDPGPHTLRASVSEQSNTERLTWTLTRATGYAGVTNLLGSRFLSDPDSVAPVLTFLARRGLLFFDSGPDSRSVAQDIARQANAPYVQSAVAVDNIPTAMEIDARLSELEARARADGAVAGTGFLYPVTIERVANWAAGLGGRGFVLVPPSAIVPRSK